MTVQNQSIATEPEMGEDPLSALAGAIAAQLSIHRPSAQRNAVIASSLLHRARQSAAAHRDFVTLRREARSFVEVGVGQRSHMLRVGQGVRIDLVHLTPGSTLVWPAGAQAQEILVMQGRMHDSFGSTFPRHGLVLQREPSQSMCAGDTGAHLYVRQLLDMTVLPVAEQTWWSSAESTQADHWEPLSEGVDIMGLRCVGGVVSTLTRVAPGAVVMDHAHSQDEDCLMLQGELFLGDILLREDDYQLASVGGTHVNGTSDTGALFYFHGCMPTAL